MSDEGPETVYEDLPDFAPEWLAPLTPLPIEPTL